MPAARVAFLLFCAALVRADLVSILLKTNTMQVPRTNYGQSGITNLIPTTGSNVAIVQYLLLQPANLTIPPCQTETSLTLTASYFKNPQDSSYGIGACPFLPMEFAIFRMERFFSVTTATWVSNGTAAWDPPIYGDIISEDFGSFPRLTFSVPYVAPLANVTKINISSPELLEDFQGWRNGSLPYTGWALVMNTPPQELVLTGYEDGDPSCYATFVINAALGGGTIPPLQLLITTSPTPGETCAPTAMPTATPSRPPTASPTRPPTAAPTASAATPTAPPTSVPTAAPTSVPTGTPSSAPTALPTSAPTGAPTTSSPTNAPTNLPTVAPTTAAPTAQPTRAPTTAAPTTPSSAPTISPTVQAISYNLTLETRCVSSINTTTGSSVQPRAGYGAIVTNAAGSSQPDGTLVTLFRPSSYTPIQCGRSVTNATLEFTVFWTYDYGTRPQCMVSFNASIYRALQPVSNLSALTWATAPSYNASAPLATFTLPPSANMTILEGLTARFSLSPQALAGDIVAWQTNASAWVMAADVSTAGCFFELLTVGPTASRLVVETTLGDTPLKTCAPTAAPTTAAPTLAPTLVPTSAPTTAVPTALPTAAPTTATPSQQPTAPPTSAPSASPTHVPTMQAATITVPSNATLTVSPPGSPLVMSMRASTDTELVVRTLTEPEKNETYVACPALAYTTSLAAYEINSDLPPGNVTINLTLSLTDKPYGTPDRDVYLCLNGSWQRTLDVCRSLNASNAVSGTFDADMRTLVATLCHFSTYMVAEYDNATRTCVSGKYGCLCDDGSVIPPFGVAVLVAVALLALGRLVYSSDYAWKFEVVGGIVFFASFLIGTSEGSYDHDPDSPIGSRDMRISVATLMLCSALIMLVGALCFGEKSGDTDNWMRFSRGIVPVSAGAYVFVVAAFGVAVEGVSGRTDISAALAAVAAFTTLVEAQYAWSYLPPSGSEPIDDNNPSASVRARFILRLVCAGCIVGLGAFVAMVPCGTTYKGPV